jgi:D-hexose-6-phosphate mutarotase
MPSVTAAYYIPACTCTWFAAELIAACLAACLQISDSGSGAVVEVHKSGFPDAVVWNPWVAKAQAMADFGDNEYKVRRWWTFCCEACTL